MMKSWLKMQLSHIPSRHPLAEVILLRACALARPHALFRCRSLCSFIATVTLNNVESFARLRDVLQRMTDGHLASCLDGSWN